MIMKIEKARIWNEMLMAYFKVLLQHLPGQRKSVNIKKVRIASKPSEIHTRYGRPTSKNKV
jgi:hypothetical protein